MPNVIIFGAGISGLTVAHELLEKGYGVTMYEKLSDIGGMARSRREPITNMPTEHSWRGFGPFYQNVRNILKQIPTSDNKTVFNELTTPANFILPKDNITNPDFNLANHITYADLMIIYRKFLYILMAGKSRTNSVYASENLRNYFYPKLSKYGNDYLTVLGPWLGLDQFNTSFLDVSRVLETNLNNHDHEHTGDDGKEWVHRRMEKWHLMKKPTSEAWFYPWLSYLKSKGLNLVLNTELVDVNINGNDVESCVITGGEIVKADKYVIAINPFNFADIISKNSELQKDPNMIKCQKVVKSGSNTMISFRISFSDLIKMPTNNTAFSLPDSEFNITFYPQETFFDKDVYLGDDVKSLWSGTACICTVAGELYGLPADRCSKQQFVDEIHYQISRCKQLQSILKKYNDGKDLSNFNIIDIEVWYEWKFGKSGELVKNESKKWVSNTYTHPYRPSQKTKFSNLFLSGSHTDTSIIIWSMEGAVESGKRTVKYMGENVDLYTHRKPKWTTMWNKTDNILYKLCLPNVVTVSICIVISAIIVLVVFLIKSKK